MATTQTPKTTAERLDLITRRIPTQDVWGLDLIKERMDNESKLRTLRTLWATSPTGRPHVGYFIPLLKMVEFLAADVEVVIYLLDVYSFLDNVKYPMEQVLHRMEYYKYTVHAMFEMLLGRPISSNIDLHVGKKDTRSYATSAGVKFFQESTLHFMDGFIKDQWRLWAVTPQQAVRESWDRAYNPDMLSPMLCPGLQSLAEEWLHVDFQFGGTDQRGLFTYAERFLPQLGYSRRAHLMNPMLPNLFGDKMSSSHPPNTKIRLLDDEATVKDKVAKAHERSVAAAAAADNTTENSNGTSDDLVIEKDNENGILATLRDILIPISQLQDEGIVSSQIATCPESNESVDEKKISFCPRFTTPDAPKGSVFTVTINKTADGGGEEEKKRVHFKSFEEIQSALQDKTLDMDVLVQNIADAIDSLMRPLREAYETNEDWQKADRLGYPEES
ncbi:tyrosine tRNA ligase [Rhypophila decipiens]|uniref:tyrosine--tRNA ligase n=1 Tax=Rhypophila decipiens TaxID=261697 RepID=A0AAN6YHN9_9PEZI|nr:tyrosine tRNA ligase [Rhypophila decipiens]